MTKPAVVELPRTGAVGVAEETSRFGSHLVETGGFLLAPEETERVTVVAFAGEAGILRRWGLFQISELALDRIFGFADEERLWIPAQFHSHWFGDELSATDRDHGLRVGGFISAVVPNYINPSCDPQDWGWWRFDGAQWVRVGPAAATEGDIQFVVFDEDGVRGP